MLPKDPLVVAYMGPYMSYSTLWCHLAPHAFERNIDTTQC
jgi:hypothetical protein